VKKGALHHAYTEKYSFLKDNSRKLISKSVIKMQGCRQVGTGEVGYFHPAAYDLVHVVPLLHFPPMRHSSLKRGWGV